MGSTSSTSSPPSYTLSHSFSSLSLRENKSNRGEVSLHSYIATGSFKNVAKGLYTEGERKGQSLVAKTFKSRSVFASEYFDKEMLVIKQALILIESWNKSKIIDKIIRLNQSEIWHQVHPPHEYCLIEPFIHDFIKFNSNSGWCKKDKGWNEILQALSHFSYHTSNGELLLCDLQGAIARDHLILTDPVIQSMDKRFGPADFGKDGIFSFFKRHKCNKYCSKKWIIAPIRTERDWILIPELQGTSMTKHAPSHPSKHAYTPQILNNKEEKKVKGENKNPEGKPAFK